MAEGAVADNQLSLNVIAKLELELDQAKKALAELTQGFSGDINKVFATFRLQSTKEDGFSDEEKEHIAALKNIKGATDKIADIGVGFIKKTFGLVEDIYAKLKAASPLLQAVEQLFNLAWTLFFMPIGNKLAEELIPAVLSMMDTIAGLWEAFDGMTLGGAFAYAIKMGVEILGSFFMEIGNQLEQQGGFIGAIGTVLNTIGSVIKYHGENILNTVLNLASFLMQNIREIIATIVAFKVASLAMQTALIWTVAVSNTLVGKVGGGMAAAATGTAAAATAATTGTMTAMGATALALGASYGAGAVAGGVAYNMMGGFNSGASQYATPKTTVSNANGGATYNLNFYGYNDDEFVSRVEDVISNGVSQSRLRSGF